MKREPDVEAVAWARQYVRERDALRARGALTLSGHYLKWLFLLLDRSHRHHSDQVRKRCEVVIQRARRGERQAHKACIVAAVDRLRNDNSLPEPLAAYVADFLRSGGKRKFARRGADPKANLFRDIAIFNTVLNLQKRFAVPPTRNDATTARESGCSIVTQLLKEECGLRLTEDAIEKIWKRLRKQPDIRIWD